MTVSGGVLARGAPEPPSSDPWIHGLCELAARLQRGRSGAALTVDGILETAGRGALELGLRLAAFQVVGDELVLRRIATAPVRLELLERELGRPLRGLRAPLGDWRIIRELIARRAPIYGENLRLFDRLLSCAAGYDAAGLEAAPATASISNGVVAPLFVRNEVWGLLEVVAPSLTRNDASSISLFAAHVASALEVAESFEALETANRELARTQRELVKRERMAAVGELAAVMAHEIRNPLAVLFNSLSSLRRILTREEAQPAAAEHLLSIAGEEADRLSRIVNDLLDFARPMEPRFTRLALTEVVQEVLADLSGQAGNAQISFQPELSALPSLELDPRLVRQALLNVLLNSLQATPAKGTLKVRLCLEPGYARVEVEDSGPGIPAELQERIFEPFFTTKASGTGLGLAVVKRVMELHQGDVSLSSSPAGSTMVLRFPLART